MKKNTKQAIALLLAIFSLVSLAMPTVFATQATGEDSGTAIPPAVEGENIPEPVTYQFYSVEQAGKKLADQTAAIKTAYDAGESNWRYEGTNYTWQMRPGGANTFAPNTQSMEFVCVENHWIAVRIQSPGAGKFDLSYVHGAKDQGAELGSLYIVKASVIDEALGENAASYADAISADPCTANSTAAITSMATAIDAAIAGKQSVIDSNYYAESVTSNLTDTGSFTFEENTEYVLVFKSITKADDASSARLLLTSLTASYAANQEEEEENTRVPVDYVFANAALDDQALLNLTAGFKDAYDAGESNWRYEAASTVYQFRDQNVHEGVSGIGNNKYFLSNLQFLGGNKQWFALRLKSPGEGKYELSLKGGTYNNGATVDIYFIKASTVDEKLGENAAAYAETMSEDPYAAGATDAFSAFKTAIGTEMQNAAVVMTAEFVNGTSTTGNFTFEAEAEYIMVINVTNPTGSVRVLLNALTATPVAGSSEEPEIPDEPEAPAYTEGVYDFFEGKEYGTTLNVGKDMIAQKYDAGILNWKYEAKYSSLNLNNVKYNQKTNSMYAVSSKHWWLAFRIKAPAEDGAYDIKMVHGAMGDGAVAGSIFVIPGDTATEDIAKVMTRTGEVMTADWFYGEKPSDVIGGRETTTGSVNLRAGQEYIIIFMPTEPGSLSKNASFAMGQLSVTRTGDIVEDESGEEEDDGSIRYEFYDWDHPGDYLNHYRTEEELKKQILTEEIAEKYANGELNWCYQNSNGYAQFSTGTPYLEFTVGEKYYYCLKIKSPGTGTYEITYDHYASAHARAALRGSIYIVPAEEGMDFAAIRGEADFKEAVITTSYKADKTTKQQSVGTYTAFEEGKEYFLCFSAEDDDTTKNSSLSGYPLSLTMKRIGEYAPVAGEGADDGIVYKLPVDEFVGKRYDTAGVSSTIAERYEQGTMNWKFESGVGSAEFAAKYVKFGTSNAGACWAIRIKSPGTGMYKVTLKHMLGTDVNAATAGELYIVEAPEETIAGNSLTDYIVKQPVMEYTSSTGGTRFKKVSESGTYGFVEGREYVVIFYANDISDSRNTTKNTYFYIDRLVLKRTGDYVEPETAPNSGGIIAKDVVKQFKVGARMTVTMNGHDYLVLCVYGGIMMIYDLDEWRLVDEVDTGIATPDTICQDMDGNWWITGVSQSLYCYNPYTRTGFSTGKITKGGRNYQIVCGDDGILYFGAYASNGLYIFRYDPKTLKYTSWQPEEWATQPGAVKQKGDYIYIAAAGDGRYEVWKVDKTNGSIVDRVNITDRMNGERYVQGMSWLDDEHLLVITYTGITVVNTTTMELLSDEKIGLRGTVGRYTSGVIDGKNYFVTNAEGVCYYDLETKTFGTVGGELANFKTGFLENCTATIEDSRLSGRSIITYSGMSSDGLNIYAINLETKSSVTLIGLVEPGFGTGTNAHTIFKGAPGSNEIIYGPMYPDFPARVYNIETGELAREFMTNGQNDSYCYYQGKMYFGNYTSCILTRMDDGVATKLFILNDENFNQSRIHSVCGGDDKVFIGTVPDDGNWGGVIAWYDLKTELTYVVTGPNPEDVYYAKASKATINNKWYNVATGKLVEDMSKEWDKDQDGDGVYQYFKGPIPLQSIVKVVYSDGLLYGLSCLRGGTGSADPTGLTAKVFIYDVENMKMLEVIDLADHIQGVPNEIRYITSLTADPEISNKMWGVVAETLFSLTYDKDTGKVRIQEELSFDKNTISQTESICQDIYFDGDDMYVLFGAKGGLCKVNRNDPTDYKVLMGDFQRRSQVPTQFVLGDDGDIYYVSNASPHIYVLNVDVTEEELAEAKAVQDAIDLIPAEVTLADREMIFAAREAWDTMAPANQPFVNNYSKLEDAETTLLQVRIDALGEITIEDEEELVSIRNTYTTLELSQRMKIDYMRISNAESIMSVLRGERTTNLIASIGEVTLEKEQLIRAVRASYMALTRYERTLVKNIEVLNAAESAFTGLLMKKNEAASVDKLIDKIGFVFFAPGKILDARKAYNALEDQAKEWVTKQGTLVLCEVILVAEYLIALAAVTGGVLYAIPATRTKIFKKKAKEESTKE